MKGTVKLIGVFLVIGLTGCAHLFSTTPLKAMKVVKYSNVRAIEAKGKFHLNIVTGAKSNQMVIAGDNELCRKVRVILKHGTLYISNASSLLTLNVSVHRLQRLKLSGMKEVNVRALSRANMDIEAHHVDCLRLNGNFTLPTLTITGASCFTNKGSIKIGTLNSASSGTINIKRLRSDRRMTINDAGSGKIILRGTANIEHINKTGTGDINLSWVNSNRMIINASGQGTMTLSGKAKKLDVKLTDKAFLNARYLRADIVLIKTYERALAYVHPINRLFAYANRASQINYYGTPPRHYAYTHEHGLVLPMGATKAKMKIQYKAPKRSYAK